MTTACLTTVDLVAGVYIAISDGTVRLACAHCWSGVAPLPHGGNLAVALGEVRNHALVCAKWIDHERMRDAAKEGRING